jgi:hypothetical protein
MKKFAPLVITAAAMAFAGCAVDTGAPSETATGEDIAASCTNPEGTNAAIAVLAEAITHELHRWQLTTDFYVGTGSNNQQVLKLTSAGLAACNPSGCPETQNILAVQDSTMDQQVVIDGTRVSSWSFASRVVTGFGNQKTCQQNRQCPFVAHVFDYQNGSYVQPTISAGPCMTLFTHPVSAPGGAALTSTQVNQLANALIWTTGNGANPYIAFQGTASTVSIDPGGNLNPPGQTGSGDTCQVYSPDVNLTGQSCVCSTTGVTNGQLKADRPLTKSTYYCRQI